MATTKPTNNRKKWDQDDLLLVTYLDQGLPVAQAAQRLGRSEMATLHRMKWILYLRHKNGEVIDSYYGRWPLTKEEMEAFIASGGAYTPYQHELETRVTELEKRCQRLEDILAKLPQ